MADSHDVQGWIHDLTTAGWTAESSINWRAPDGSLWRGPYGAWKELQRRLAATNPTPTQQETLEPCPFCPDGGNPYFTKSVNGSNMAYVGCSQCGVQLKAQVQFLTSREDWTLSKDIVGIWNTRRAAVAGPRIDRDLIKNIVNAVSLCVEKVEGGCSLNVKNADERVAEVLFNAATSSPTPAEKNPRCVKCGHFSTVDIHNEGECQVRGQSGFICGCKCEFRPTCLKCGHNAGVERTLKRCKARIDGGEALCQCHCEFAPAERTRVEGETAFFWCPACQQKRLGQVEETTIMCLTCKNVCDVPPGLEINSSGSDSARRAAEEIADYVSDGILGMGNEVTEANAAKFLEIIARHFPHAAAPADDDALEVCRLLSTLDWVVGYELAGENQIILDRAQELALKVKGMSDPPATTKGDR